LVIRLQPGQNLFQVPCRQVFAVGFQACFTQQPSQAGAAGKSPYAQALSPIDVVPILTELPKHRA
jgi:hypothetical protein